MLKIKTFGDNTGCSVLCFLYRIHGGFVTASPHGKTIINNYEVELLTSKVTPRHSGAG